MPYILRTCAPDMTSYRGRFTWPRYGHVVAPDWNPSPECGGGLHGFLNGEGDGSLADWSARAVWLVARVEEWVDLGGNVKAPDAWVEFTGDRKAATDYLQAHGCHGAIIGCYKSGGDRSNLVGGHGSTLTGGDYSTLTGGHRSTLTGGDASTLTGGDHSTLTGGYDSTLTGDYYSTLTGGYGSTLMGGYDSVLSFAWYSRREGRRRRRITTAYVGENGIKPSVRYRVDDTGCVYRA